MHTEPLRLSRLPQAAAISVRAATLVASPSEVLAEAVANSLDAGATEINAELDLAAWGLRVQDNGCGIPPARLCLLGRRCMPPTAARAVPALGYRGEALAAVCTVAEEVEVISRAAGSFETHRVLLREGQAVQQGLAPEQRSRQATVVVVRGVFFNQPVRRKALLSDGLVREVERCKQACLQLVLLRPEVTLTCFDRSQRAFLLRLIKGRSQRQDVALFLGQEQEDIAAVQLMPGTAPAISGYATVPPHGQPNASRQLVLLNGRSISAPPVSRLVDELFAQLYKPNMRLHQSQAGALLQVHRAAHLHAAFVLHISCDASQYELAHEAGAHLVQFASWGPLLQVLRHALLAAWRPVLSDSLLKQLEQLEGSPGAAQSLPQGTAQHLGLVQTSFQVWLEEQHQGTAVEELVSRAGRSVSGGKERCERTVLLVDEPVTGREGGRASAGRGSGGRQQLAGAKHALTSQLVRYSGLQPAVMVAVACDQNSLPDGCSADAHLRQLITEQPHGKRARASAPARHTSSPACGMQQQEICADAASSWVLPGRFSGQGQQAGLKQHGARPGGQGSPHPVMLQSPPQLLWQRPCSTGSQQVVQLGPEMGALVGSWGALHQGRHVQPQLEPEQLLHDDCEMSGERTSDGCVAVEDVLGSWRPLQFSGSEQQGWLVPGQAEAGTSLLQNPGSQAVAQPSDHALLELSAAAAGARLQQRRPQSAPPHIPHHSLVGSRDLTSSAARGFGQHAAPAAAPVLPTSPTFTGQPSTDERSGLEHERRLVWPSAGGRQTMPGALQHAALPASVQVKQQQQQQQGPHFSSWAHPRGGSPADSSRQAGTSQAAQSVLSLDAVSSAAFAELRPATLARQHLAGGRVIQQVDCKFLAVASGSLLLLVDQHAADERVQLERLRDQLLSSGGQPGRVQSQMLQVPLLLGLTDAEGQLLNAYADKVAAWGWRWQPSSAGSLCGLPQTLLTHAPLLWGTVLTATDLTLYLHQLQDTYGSGAVPPAVVRVLNSKACRGAVMFGDRLPHTQCQELLADLAQTQLCFSCAHGRPTAAPVVDFQLLRRALHLRRAAQLTADAGAPGTSSAKGPGLFSLKSRLLRML